MSDKKDCRNCASCKNMLCYAVLENTSALPTPSLCSHWLRNPSLWLSILPTEPGWYWWKPSNDMLCQKWILELYLNDDKQLVFFDNAEIEIENYGGIWQGPITPKEASK